MALIPPFFLDTVVAIGIPTGNEKIEWVASGFLYGDLIEKNKYKIFLVTNRHVLEDHEIVYLRFNPEAAERAREYELVLKESNGTLNWFAHPDHNVDVAIIPIVASILREQKIRFAWFYSDKHVMDRTKANELGLTEGDGIFVLGFPMGLVGEERNFVIVRQGCIARIRDTLAGTSKEFLVDSTVFPGNSGGPVVTKPDAISIQGTKSIGAANLIGMVKAYVPYRDVAISAQTKQPRIIFEENSGLTTVIPIDFVIETVQEAIKKEKEGPKSS